MGSGWEQESIGNLCEKIFSGGTPKTTEPQFWNGNLNWLSSGETRNNFISDTEKKITKLGVKKSSTKLAKKGDLVMACAGQGHTRGQTSFCLIDTYVNQSVITIRTNPEKLFNLFLFYKLKSLYNKLRNLSDSSSIRGSITCPLIRELEISYPESLETQQKIATILSNYDDLIENNEKRIKILENVAKLIYEEWFVRFKFPGYEKIKMVDSGTEFGMIPEGWKVKPFSDFCSKITDGTHEVIKPVENGFYMVSATNLKDGFIDFSKTHFISEKDHKKIMLRSKPEKGDILFSKIGTIGNIAVVKQDFEFSIKNIALFKPLSNELSSFIYSYFNNDSNLANFSTKASGTSQKFFSLAFLRNMNLVFPEEKIILNFDRVVYPILEQRHMLNEKNQNLRKTRDLLLPKLISGEIDVSELDIQLNQEVVNT